MIRRKIVAHIIRNYVRRFMSIKNTACCGSARMSLDDVMIGWTTSEMGALLSFILTGRYGGEG